MKSLIRSSFLIAISLFMNIHYCQAQASGVVKGVVKDEGNKPIEFVTVVLFNSVDSAMVKGTITDSLGLFLLDNIKSGKYFVRLSFVGYKNYTSESFDVAGATHVLGDVVLPPDQQVLSEVVVTGERPVVERIGGKILVNVSSGAFKTASNAIDILKNAPSLVVDNNGAITVKGVDVPQIMIDGRSATLAELRSIPAASIETVEIITNPSAKYEADSHAVINIKLKRDTNLGTKGRLNGKLGYNEEIKYEGGINLDYKAKQINIFGSYEYFNEKSLQDIDIRRTIQKSDSRDILYQRSSTINHPSGHFYSAGFDYSINAKHSMGVLLRGYSYGVDGDGNSLTTIDNSGDTQYLRMRTLSNNDNAYHAANLHHRVVLDTTGQEIQIEANFSNFNIPQLQNLANQYFSDEDSETRTPTNFKNYASSKVNIASAKIDYILPLKNKGTLELGARVSSVKSTNILQFDSLYQQQWITDEQRSNEFIYKEFIAAGYLLYSVNFKKNFFQAGLRGEQTVTEGNSITLKNVVDRNYFYLLPNVKFQRNLNEKASVDLGYAMRITRPSYQDLNPFLYYIDPYSFTEGNPYLVPSKEHQVDLSFSYGSLNTSVFYRYGSDVILQLTDQNDETNVLRYFMDNVDKRQVYGFDASFAHNINAWWKVQAYFVAKQNEYRSYFLGSVFDNKAFSYNGQVTNAFRIMKQTNIEISFNYRSATVVSINRLDPVYSTTAGVQRSFLQGALEARLKLSDVFHTIKQVQRVDYVNLDSETSQRWNTRSIDFSLTYRFGKSTFRRPGREIGNGEEEGRVKQ